MNFLLQEQELSRSREAISRDFYRSYDASLVEHLLERLPQEVLGEGRHFKSYRLKTRGPLDLALNLAKPAFGEPQTMPLKAWEARMKKLQSLTHPLLPPLELLHRAGVCAYVMPYCEEIVPAARWDQLGIRPLMAQVEGELAKLGLVLDDYWQLRSCRGHPFVTDFSDLIVQPR